jgi:hypothetical protein
MPPTSPRSEVPGSLLLHAIYTVEELMLRLGWSTATLEAAHCRGLRIRYFGSKGYVLGSDVAAFFLTEPAPVQEKQTYFPWYEAKGDGTPAPCTPDVAPGFAEEAWAKAQGCCEVCNGPASIVTRWPESSRPVVLCRHHFEKRGGE